MISVRQRLLVFFFPLLLSLPFINRAYFVDDSYFVQIANWVKDHPTQPYHFRADDAGLQTRGWEEDGFVRLVNPMLHHYYLAFLLRIGGEHEWFLRLGCVLLSCFSGLFILGLARRWTSHALLATLLVLATPVHWLSAHSLLIDSTMGFFFMGGLYFFIRLTETEDFKYALISGLMMGCAFLSKYPSLLLIPLTGVWLVFRWKKLGRPWLAVLAWFVGLGILTAYQVWSAHLYGRPHIFAASQRMMDVFGWPKIMVFFIFFSGASLLPVIGWAGIGRRRLIVYSALMALFAIIFSSRAGGFSGLQAFLLSFWFMTTIVFGVAFVLRWKEWIFPRDHFLFIWVLGFFGMMFVVMGWVAGRYYVIVAPAIGLLTVRLVEINWNSHAQRILKMTLACLVLFTAVLAYADYNQAGSARKLAQQLKAKGIPGGPRHFYLGDSFTVSYLQKDGWTPCFPNTDFQPGDLVVAHEVTMPLVWFFKRPLQFKEIDRFEYPTLCPIKVMHFKGSAGFYASVWGALPFTFEVGPWERYHLLQITGVPQGPAAPSAY